MLRDLEQVPLYSENSLNGFFFHESLNKLFHVLSSGYREKENGHNKSFKVRHIDSPIFDDRKLHHLHRVKFRNKIWQDIICRLSLSKQQRNKTRGRISYANLGINQLGSVYESLLAYRGFYADQDYIEVHKKDKQEEGTYLVPRSRRDDFKEDEILKNENHEDIILKKGKFVYRLSGRDRQKSASYYTPEVLTRCTVKYTLKPILEKLEKGDMKALELLDLKLLEPAMGAAAFHNEMINQLAEAYISYRQKELRDSGRKEWKIEPDQYKEELQKVKAYIATHNVYGVDLNPTAIELGKLSLWLNVIHRDMETPFFSNRICVGNAVVGAWLKVYAEKDLTEEYEIVKSEKGKDKKNLVKKEWWEKAPRQLDFKPNSDFEKIKTNRKQNEIYHFLLPDKNMVPSASIKILKAENSVFSKGVATWKKEWTKPLSKTEFEKVKAISNTIDELLAEYYRFQRNINLQTGSRQNIFGATRKNEQGILQMQSYDEKEKLADQRNRHSAPYFKLKIVMDYWCSLWFWDVRQADELPNRAQYWSDIANILQLDIDKIVSKETEENIQAGLQGKLFYTGGEQLALGEETEDAPKVFEAAVVEYAERKDLFDENERLKIVGELAKKYFFFHPQLEFLEVFWERGGFDLISGNPPWVKIEFEEKHPISETMPEILVKDLTAPEVKRIVDVYLKTESNKAFYLQDFIETENLKCFLTSSQNYFQLKGQKTNLYKNFIIYSLQLLSKNGFIGLLHPESIYDDPNAYETRHLIYSHLANHFQFQNQLFLFSEVGHRFKFSINILRGEIRAPSFFSINNLFHPSTIDGCFVHDGKGECEGIKYKNADGEFVWNLMPHKSRLIEFDEEKLKILSKIFNNTPDNWEGIQLAVVHSENVLMSLKNISEMENRVKDIEYISSIGWFETNDVNAGIIKRKTCYPNNLEDFGLIYSGPHFYVSNPLYKTPREKCTEKSHYDIIDLIAIDETYLPRTNYVPNISAKAYRNHSKNKGFTEDDNILDYYKAASSKMLNQAAERTLQTAIIPPNVGHIDGIYSVTFPNTKQVVEFTGICSSIIMDFFVKLTGANNLIDNTIKYFPINLDSKYLSSIFVRTLLLNCVNKYYSDLWEEHFENKFISEEWSKDDDRLKSFEALSENWNIKTPLRNSFERRQALIEIDVILSMAFDINLNGLTQIYKSQFPVLVQNEDDTWYDKTGNIVFTCSKGLVGVGVDSNIWKTIQNLADGETFEHIIKKSELYKGKKITYLAPFTKCDRVEDYNVAWKHFEKKFKDK